MGDRFSRSLALAKESIAVLRRTPSLMWFPVISGIVTLVLTISFFIPLYIITGGKDLEKVNPAVGYPVMALFYFVSYFIVIFFNAGLVSCAHDSLHGRDTSFGHGFQNAMRHLPAILGWTLIASTVGMILQMIAERSGIIGRIVVALLGAAWNIITYFVVPILVVEQGSPVAAVKKSGGMLKRTWGENLIGNGGIGFVLVFAALVPVLPMVIAFAVAPVAGLVLLAISILYWLALGIAGAAMQGVYQTALYVYAETGTTPSGFSPEYISGAFTVKEPGMLDKLRRR
ncbi:MAG: DUF6159 family protein [Fimbriimonas sp.]